MLKKQIEVLRQILAWNEEVICVKEKALDKLRYRNI